MEELQLNPMQPSKPTVKPELVDPDAPANAAVPDDAGTADDAVSATLLGDSLEQGKALLNEHKGKLAIGVAATLGLMVFYKWREKKLAEEDPEEYARLQRIKAVVREQEAGGSGKAFPDDED